MNAYSVTPSGNVIRASKVVERKLQELAAAQERLIIAKLQDSMRQQTTAPVAVTPKLCRASSIRKQAVLIEWQRRKMTNCTVAAVRNFLVRLSSQAEFNWCLHLHEASYVSITNYIMQRTCKQFNA